MTSRVGCSGTPMISLPQVNGWTCCIDRPRWYRRVHGSDFSSHHCRHLRHVATFCFRSRWKEEVLTLVCSIFGAIVVLTEVWTPALIMSHLAFLRTFVGRGLTYIFLGCIILRDSGINAFAGGITIGFGILYLIFACIPGMKVLSLRFCAENFQSADVHLAPEQRLDRHKCISSFNHCLEYTACFIYISHFVYIYTSLDCLLVNEAIPHSRSCPFNGFLSNSGTIVQWKIV